MGGNVFRLDVAGGELESEWMNKDQGTFAEEQPTCFLAFVFILIREESDIILSKLYLERILKT